MTGGRLVARPRFAPGSHSRSVSQIWSVKLVIAQMWQYQSDDRFRDPQQYPLGYAASCNPGTFTKLQYRVDATRRAILRALQALEKLKAEAAAAPAPAPVVEPQDSPSLTHSPQTTSPQIGFFLPSPIADPPKPDSSGS